MPKAVVLLSGGLDSATVMALVGSEGYEIYALSFDYGQRHRVEIESARKLAQSYGALHVVVPLPSVSFQGSSLTTKELSVPKREKLGEGIPNTYVPARNTVFLSFALGFGETVGAFDIFIGANSIDYSGYPDCRCEYLTAYEQMANLALKETVEGRAKVKIHAPLLSLTKAEIVALGLSLGVDYSITHSCYDPDEEGRACARCDSCAIRLRAFAENNVVDPAPYRY
jgi:7-cyano-7-deazaguanine synthase